MASSQKTDATAEESAGRTVDLGTVEDTSTARPAERRVDRLTLRQEGMRGAIALSLLALLGIALVWALSTASTWPEMRELLEIWLPALTGLLGSAVGFYFGTRP